MASINVDYWTEKTVNHLPQSTVDPGQRFEAVRTASGSPWLFSIGTDGVLYLSEGSKAFDLSSALIRQDFPGDAGARCLMFGSSASATQGTLGLAMVVRSGAADHLYLCLGQSLANRDWAAAPRWLRVDKDDGAAVTVVGLLMDQTGIGKQVIVVDVVRDPSVTPPELRRFTVTPDLIDGVRWHDLQLAVELAASDFYSCLGQVANGYVDGLYTFGRIGGSGQFLYCPLENAFGDGPPLPELFNLPHGASPSAIVTSRNDDLSTDLFVISGGTLYRFAAADQKDGPMGVPLVSNYLFTGTLDLCVTCQGATLTLWGRNASNELYNMTAPLAELGRASSWSVPALVVANVERVSRFGDANRDDSPIFCTGAGVLLTITRTGDGPSWQIAQSALPDLPSKKDVSFTSHLVSVLLTDDAGKPLPGATVSLSANISCLVYINKMFYKLSPTPLRVQSDADGFLYIIELPGMSPDTRFTLSTGSGPDVEIDPYQLEDVFTVCFVGTGCTRDEGERTRAGSDVRIYAPETGYIPVRIHKEISGALDAMKPSVTVRGAGENDWATPRNDSEKLMLDGPLSPPASLLNSVRSYSGGDQSGTGLYTGWPIPALALHGANLAANSGAKRYNFIGHSRGAVECIMAAWFLYAYGRHDIPVNIFAIDPVPGTGNWYSILSQLPPNVANYVGIYAWDMCVAPADVPFQALVPRPNRRMAGLLNPDETFALGSDWDTLAENYQQIDPLAPGNVQQPTGYELYACRGRHSTVTGNTTADGAYDPTNISDEVAPVPRLVYRLARAYLTRWGTGFQVPSAVSESVTELRRQIHLDHRRVDTMGGGATRTSLLPDRPYVRRISSICGRNPFNNYFMDDVVGDPPYRLAYPVTAERAHAGWVQWKFL